MTDAGVKAHTVQAHGAAIARKHLQDWLILPLLVGIDVAVNRIHPFNRFVGLDMMDDLKYPFHPNTIPFWGVQVFVITLPVIIFLIRYLRRKDVHDLHQAVLGTLYAVLITGLITDSIKGAVGRPRPNFFWRCFPDGIDYYDRLNEVICTGDPIDIREGHKSFPSGHTSWSFAGLGFLSLYFAGKIQAFDRRSHAGKLCVVFLPILVAALIGVSRVDDYWHHWTDVFAGALIGLTVSFFCYLQFFPAPHHTQGWGPYSYFRALEKESQTNGVNDTPAITNNISPHFTPPRDDHSVTIG